MKHIFGKTGCWLFVLLTALCSQRLLAIETQYITEALTVYLHGGPSKQHRIIGAVKAGDPVTVLTVDQEKQFAQIQDRKGRTAWVSLDHLTQQPSLKSRLPKLEEQVTQLTSQLQSVNSDWHRRTAALQQQAAAGEQQLQKFQQENSQLTEQLGALQKRLQGLKQQANEQQRQLYWEWFQNGGIVAGAGVLLGLILPTIATRRRHRDRWMN